MKKSSYLTRTVRDSLLIGVLLGVPAGVFANTISSTLSQPRPNWLYVTTASLLVITAILVRVLVGLIIQLNATDTIMPQHLDGSATQAHLINGIVHRPAEDRLSLGDIMSEAERDVLFFGIIAKRSVNEDSFRRALERSGRSQIKIRFLLLDPYCSAFSERAEEEREDADAWRSDYEATIARLRAYKKTLGVDISLRITENYPIWRVMILDSDRVCLSPFLPRMRGTEAMQYDLSQSGSQLAYGWVKYSQVCWDEAREVML